MIKLTLRSAFSAVAGIALLAMAPASAVVADYVIIDTPGDNTPVLGGSTFAVAGAYSNPSGSDNIQVEMFECTQLPDGSWDIFNIPPNAIPVSSANTPVAPTGTREKRWSVQLTCPPIDPERGPVYYIIRATLRTGTANTGGTDIIRVYSDEGP